MKIKALYFKDVGPLGDQCIDLVNDWNDSIEPRSLLSGPNGCGKSTVLRTVAMLWEALGYWLDQRKLDFLHSDCVADGFGQAVK